MKLFAGQHVEQLSQPTTAPNERHASVLPLLPRDHLKLESRARMFRSVQQNVEIWAGHSAAIVALLLLCAVPVSAQTSSEKAADWISTGLVGVNLGADIWHDVKHHCVKNLLIRNGLTIGAAELTKLFVHEDRPDFSDRKSFYSEHSALAMANYGWSYRIGFSVALGAGVGRVVASKHHPTDVLVGLAAGLGASYLFPCEAR